MLKFAIPLHNNRANQIDSTIGPSPILKLRTGAAPIQCASADQGTVLCSIPLPGTWISTAVNGLKTKIGSWQANATATGSVGHFRLYDSTGTTCYMQGSVTITDNGGDLEVDNTIVISIDQIITVTNFTLFEDIR